MSQPWYRVLIEGYNVYKGGAEFIRSSNNALKTLSTEHERIHAGKYFRHSEVHSLATGVSHYHYIVPNSGSHLHLRSYRVKANNGPGRLNIYENPYIDASSIGTDISSDYKNLNRASSNVFPATAYLGPYVDVNSIGEELDVSMLFDSSKDAGEESELVDHEIALTNSYGYLVRYFNDSGAAATSSIRIGIYEV